MCVTHLILSGGGVNGIQMMGALQKLEEYDKLSDINVIAGVSVGAIIGSLLCIKSIHEIISIIPELIEIPKINLKSFLTNYGLCSKLFYLEKINSHLCNYSFIEMYHFSNKQLDIYATNVTNSCSQLFNYINTPDMKVIDAIKLTMNVPFLFEYETYNNCIYVDGAVINNFPIENYNDINNNEKIGILIKLTFLQNNTQIKNIFQYIYKILSLFLLYYTKEYQSNVYVIHCSFQNMFDFTINKDLIKNFLFEGYNSII